MKKFTFLFPTVLMAFIFFGSVQAKDITVYVQADQQPNIHFWNVSNESTEWPGQAMTSTVSVKNLQGEDITFYYKTFANLSDDAAISFLFNYNGDADKTADINDVTVDHYYIYKGNGQYEDITNQFVEDATISNVQLPGDYNGWNGDSNTLTYNEDNKQYTGTINVSSLTGDYLTFKLLVNDGFYLGWSELAFDVPDGWIQEAASDGNVQLNYAAIGASVYTFTATWGGGPSANKNWTVKIDADADAVIGSVKLPGSYCGWNGDQAIFTKNEEKTYTYSLDLSETTDNTAQLKVLVNGRHWLGYNDLVNVDAPAGWAQEAESDGNIQLNLTAAGTKKFKFTATWAGGKNASAGWSLKIAAETPTGITTLTRSQNVNAPVYDLSGRKVAQPTKGLYIINGRKVIVK